jgi:hypothetical protein
MPINVVQNRCLLEARLVKSLSNRFVGSFFENFA